MSKILIIEGTDNVGKDTFIKNVYKHFNCIEYHFTSPEKYLGYKPKDVVDTQKQQFKDIFTKVKNRLKQNHFDFIILNRSHLGEYVYGQLYRKSNSDWVFNEFEKKWQDLLFKSILVYLDAPATFTIKNDDGLSHSINLNNRIKEIQLFQEAFDKTIIPKKLKIVVANDKFYAEEIIINKFLKNLKTNKWI